MTRFILAIAMAGLVSAPAFAMDDMSCADFTAMDSDAQMQAISAMEEGAGDDMMAADAPADAMASGGMMAEAMSPEDATMAVATTCKEHPDMTVGEAMGMTNE